MQRRLIRLHLFGLLFLLANPGQAIEQATEITWQAWSPEIFAQAKKENKLILLDLGAKWCNWCKKMDTVTYRNQQVVNVINENYIAVRADVDQHPELAQRYKNYGPPTTVVYNSTGTEIIKRPGYMEAQILYWMLDTVAADPDPAAHR
ncbi:hypothetical protein MNBD_GAMMA25-2087 [hydrothermal vent metagenome]|uniref:Spermatogenesis-associated protein 20-like TRX domain-containing protein n=1 Tax=hydrothermal vent metagenome TaxID=652676 RepID=A0A3B1BC20_9ZZZZ